MISLLLLLLALTASAQLSPQTCKPAPDGGVICTQPPISATIQPVPIPGSNGGPTSLPSAQSPATSPKDQFPPYLPQYLMTAGGGAVVPGHGGSFAYQCFGALMGQATYALSCQQYTVVKGQVQNCALAGLTKVTHHFGPVSFGVTGLGGGCESTNGNADPAGNAQVFASFHIGHTPLSIPVTLEKTFSAVGKQEAKITAGLIWGFGK